jgi:isochorismate synthase EntC
VNYLFIEQVEERLKNAVAKAVNLADEQLTEVVVGVQCDAERMDPLSFLTAANGDETEHFYWERPDKRESLVCLGAATTLEASGEGRFVKVTKQRADLFESAVLSGFGNKADERPILVGGFAFWDTPISSDPAWKGFPAARLMLPELVFRNSRERSTLAVYCKVKPGADEKHLLQTVRVKLEKLTGAMGSTKQYVSPPMDGSLVVNDASAEHYLKVTNAALDAISSGDIRKVVVARSREVSFKENIDTIRVLESLRRIYRSCFIFSISKGSSVFLGASPERIASLENDTVRSGPLAGSVGRGQNPAEDEHLARGLATCPKELNEHAIVVHAVRDALSPLC